MGIVIPAQIQTVFVHLYCIFHSNNNLNETSMTINCARMRSFLICFILKVSDNTYLFVLQINSLEPEQKQRDLYYIVLESNTTIIVTTTNFEICE